MQPRPRPPDLPAHEGERDQAAAIVGPMNVLADPHAPEDHRRPRAREGPRHVAHHARRDPGQPFHLLGREADQVRALRLPVLGHRLNILAIDQSLVGDDVHDRVQERHVRARTELQHVARMPLERLPARIHHDELAAALGELLEVSRGDGMVLDRVGADDDGHVGMLDLVEGRGDGGGADILHQRGDRGGVAEPRAMVDVVVPEALPDELLEQVGFLVRALGRSEPRDLPAPPAQSARRDVQRLLPGRFPERLREVARIDVQPLRRRIGAADKRDGQAMRMVDVVEAEPSLDAEPPLVGGAVDAVHLDDAAVLGLERDLTADAAERADRLRLRFPVRGVADLRRVDHRGRHQRAGRAGLNAFAAGHAGAVAHRIVEVEDRVGVVAPPGHADHVVDLHLAAGPHAEAALDAGVEVHAHRHVAVVEERDAGGVERRQAARRDARRIRLIPQMRGPIMGDLALRLIGQQHLHHHLPCAGRAGAVGGDDHALHRLADAGRGQDALACDLHHAGAAIAVGAVAGGWEVTQMGDDETAAVRHLPDRLAGGGFGGPTVECETDGVGHGSSPPSRTAYASPALSESPAATESAIEATSPLSVRVGVRKNAGRVTR